MRASSLAGILSPRPHQPSVAYRAFCQARRAMNLALLAWMRERPDPDDVDEEIAGAIAALRQLVRLVRMGGAV
jgi:hypothetical protein